jgi:hypothetical protein
LDLLHDQWGETARWLVEQQKLRPQHGVAHIVPAAVISILRWSARFSAFHFFCRGNSVLFHHLILAQKIVGLYKGMGASGFQEFCS